MTSAGVDRDDEEDRDDERTALLKDTSSLSSPSSPTLKE